METQVSFDKSAVHEALQALLSNTCDFTLALKVCAWNIDTAESEALSDIVADQHRDLWDAADGIGARLRAIGFHATAHWDDPDALPFTKLSQPPLSTPAMIALIKEGHRSISACAEAGLEVAVFAKDQRTCDLMTERMDSHEAAAQRLSDAAYSAGD